MVLINVNKSSHGLSIKFTMEYNQLTRKRVLRNTIRGYWTEWHLSYNQ